MNCDTHISPQLIQIILWLAQLGIESRFPDPDKKEGEMTDTIRPAQPGADPPMPFFLANLATSIGKPQCIRPT
jgi:hypothetical protein